MTPSSLFDVNAVAFHVLGYPMSWLELSGTLFNLASVWLVARKNIWTWPIGIVAVILFGILFYQIRLYGDFIEQIYYFVSSIYGWWVWAKAAPGDGPSAFAFSPRRTVVIGLATTLLGGAAFGYVLERLHLWLPSLFVEPASYPYWDALTTVGSFVAMILMARKRVEAWIYWIVIDVIAVVMYAAKDVKFVALLYAVFLVLAGLGLRSWGRSVKAATPEQAAQKAG